MLPEELARLEEARLALALRELADEHIEVGGGVACYGGSPLSWTNLVVAVGMDGPVSDDELDRIVAFYDRVGVEAQVALCPFADIGVARGLAARGFGVHRFETVLGSDLEDAVRPDLPDGVAFEVVDVDDAAAVDAFVASHLVCFAPDGGERAEALEVGARRMLAHPRTTAWLVRVDGELAGGAALEVLSPLATLVAAGVLERFRRRGIQRALIEHRCAVARDTGFTVATIGSAPHSPTGRNALRLGFVTAHTKTILRRACR